MRKPALCMAFFLLFSTLAPGLGFAEAAPEKDKTKTNTAQNTAKVNPETGIKEGTIVNGVDIGKMSKDELKYVPEAWRDGKDAHPSEHAEESPEPQVARSAAYPNVNSYIDSKNFKTASTAKNYKGFPRFSYRFNKPEGVVAHETANNNSTINSEINYMTRNYKNAFVHAFVDSSNVIEIHPTSLGVWGAGPYANARFIQVELVREHSFDAFARSINNYANYLASLLYENNLPVVNADRNNAGTLWSHDAVSKQLGGTTHTDPIGYFAKYGYTWTQFTWLVSAKYKEMASQNVQQTALKQSKTSKLGHIRNAKDVIYKAPDTDEGAKAAGSAYTNQVYYIKQQATYKGTTYYKISKRPSATKGVVGWVKSSDMSVHDHKGVDKDHKTFYIKGNLNAYSKAWGGSKDLVYDLSDYQYEMFDVNLTETVGKNTWYRGKVNGAGQNVWIHSSGVDSGAGSNLEYKTSRLGHIKSENVTIYATPGVTATALKAGSKYTNQVYYIKKQAYHAGSLYYLISRNPSATTGLVGWVRARDLSSHQHAGIDRNKKTFSIKGTGMAYTKAWGGSKDLVYDLSNYKNDRFEVNLTERVGGNTWYRGLLHGKTVWIHSSYIE